MTPELNMTADEIIELENEVFMLTQKIRKARQLKQQSKNRDFAGTFWLNLGTLSREVAAFRSALQTKFDLT